MCSVIEYVLICAFLSLFFCLLPISYQNVPFLVQKLRQKIPNMFVMSSQGILSQEHESLYYPFHVIAVCQCSKLLNTIYVYVNVM